MKPKKPIAWRKRDQKRIDEVRMARAMEWLCNRPNPFLPKSERTDAGRSVMSL